MTSLEKIEQKLCGMIPCRLDPATASNEAFILKNALEEVLVLVRQEIISAETPKKTTKKVPKKGVSVKKKISHRGSRSPRLANPERKPQPRERS